MSFSFLDGGDRFDAIRCPNTFEENSQIDKFFDSRESTPSPKLRRSKRIAKKSAESQQPAKRLSREKEGDQPVSETQSDKESTDSNGRYASCESSTPFHTPQAQMAKNPTTPGPPPRSLLKFAIGNATLQKAETAPQSAASKDADETLVAEVKKRKNGPRTSTPKNNPRKTIRVRATQVVGKSASITEESDAERPMNLVGISAIKKPVKAVAVERKPLNPPKTRASPKTVVKKRRSNVLGLTAASRTVQAASKPAMAPAKPRDQKRPPNLVSRSRSVKAEKPKAAPKTVIPKRKSLSKPKSDVRPKKTVTKAANPYANVKSKVAQMINNGATGNRPVLKDMKNQENKEVKKPALHQKPFLPPGKVKYDSGVDVRPGDMTVAGQTMAQFVKNFHYATPKRYRTLKPTDTFQNTCTDHTVHGVNPTIPKSPNFATNARLRKTMVKSKK